MSGGVDSSLAAAMLVEHGYDVVAATIKTFCYAEVPGSSKTCCGLEGIADARAVAQKLGIPHYVFDLEDEFTHDVIGNFVTEYAAGRTPNPCVLCNSYTKFSDLLRRARMLGCERIATGHYARCLRSRRGTQLMRATDRAKDQTYFLWGIDREVLERLELPVGELGKSEVRRRARELGLTTADKPESFDICFVPDGDYAGFLATRLDGDHPAFRPGPILTVDGDEVGQHDGYCRYTIGQRKRLPGGFTAPMYVVRIEPGTRSVIIGPSRALDSTEITVAGTNWLGDPPTTGDAVGVQIRHRGQEVLGTIDCLDGERALIRLHEAHRAVTPGQSAAIYEGDVLLGGGVIGGQ
ncbi:MAG: tRNA 2-thiouridine(34) synthase MnmA [Gemmatimonadetes bacterium]|nr:tRNA 2-thiouridine(34) synthase MnmA [Gemmatimonadota bacterium]NIO30765.1 tRNA 2-thiouridine(34) synthase MnmA [Gemmatimonadota bacterium]